jgi:hypothetical protein
MISNRGHWITTLLDKQSQNGKREKTGENKYEIDAMFEGAKL